MKQNARKNIRRLAAMLLVALLPYYASAEPVNLQTARQKAAQFAQQHGIELKDAATSRLSRKAQAISQQLVNSFYVFNLGNNQGFVIVSGDDRTEEILGYSTQGCYDEAKMPDNMRVWLESYDREIRAIPADWRPAERAAGQHQVAEQTRSMILPMVHTKWDQNSPYWNLTPMANSYSHCFTGCAATVLAQAMYYYQWPQDATAEIPSYYSSKSDYTTIGTLDALPPVTFNWAKMLPTYFYDYVNDSPNYNDDQATAVATLMQYAGHAVKMSYGSSSSGASVDALAPALVNYFDYAKSTRLLTRNYYSIKDWDNMVYGELIAGRPVIYDGFTSSEGGGHVFLIDGYDGDGYYHVNWGWGGNSDGFFLLSVLNPYNTSGSGASSSAYGYAYYQNAIFGLMPSSEYSGDDLSSMELNEFGYSGTIITERMKNSTGDTKQFEFGFGYFDAEGKLQVVYSEETGELSGLTNYIVKDIDGLLADGSYTVYAINRVAGAAQWNVFTNLSYARTVTVAGGVTTIGDAYDYGDVSMEVKDWQLIGDQKQYSNHELKVTVKNNGPDYEDELYLYGTYDNVTYSQLTQTVVTLAEGETSDVSFFFTPSQSGTLKLFVTRDYYASDYTSNLLTNGEKNYTITAGGSGETVGDVTKLQATSITIDGMIVEGGKNVVYCKGFVTGHMTIKNTAEAAYSGEARIYAIVPYHDENVNPDTHEIEVMENSYPLGQFFTSISLAAGESTTVDFVLDVSLNPSDWWHAIDENTIPESLKHDIGLLVGQGYDDVLGREVYTMNGQVEIYPDYGVEIMNANGSSEIVSYKLPIVVPATATCVDLRGFSGNGIVLNTASAQPNCLYLRYGTESGITGLPSVNVIEGTTAANIVLTDGYDFVPPFDFTAENISYTRTPSIATNGTGGWQTLVLPFAATRLVRTDTGVQLNWFQSASEGGKQLWIKDFVSIDGSDAQFDYAPTTLEAYHPYIIAVPGNRWGAAWDLSGVPLRFEGSNAAIYAGVCSTVGASSWKLTGTMASTEATDVYAINAAGTGFVKTSGTMNPFTAWFVNKTVGAPTMLRIKQFLDDSTDIGDICQGVMSGGECYTLEGIKLSAKPSKAGIYIQNGHKVIIK
ncbi:MAG: C10 family peptidase [Bacteroidaceae bacterium]|nr:C10 family peptidase [Bacteroidaceae bacterium]